MNFRLLNIMDKRPIENLAVPHTSILTEISDVAPPKGTTKMKAKQSTPMRTKKSVVKDGNTKTNDTTVQPITTAPALGQAAEATGTAVAGTQGNSVGSPELMAALNAVLKKKKATGRPTTAVNEKPKTGIEKPINALEKPSTSVTSEASSTQGVAEQSEDTASASVPLKKTRSRKITKSRRGPRKSMKRRVTGSKSATSTDINQNKAAASLPGATVGNTSATKPSSAPGPSSALTKSQKVNVNSTSPSERPSTAIRKKTGNKKQVEKTGSHAGLDNDVAPGQANQNATSVKVKRKKSRAKKAPIKKEAKSVEAAADEPIPTKDVDSSDDLHHLYRLQKALQTETDELIAKINIERKNRLGTAKATQAQGQKRCNEISGTEAESLGKLRSLLESQKKIIQIQIDLCPGLTHCTSSVPNLTSDKVMGFQNESDVDRFELFAPYACQRDGKMVFHCSLCNVSSDSELLFRLHLESPEHHFQVYKDIEKDVPEVPGAQQRNYARSVMNLKGAKKPVKSVLEPVVKVSAPEKPIAKATSGGEMLQGLV